MVKLPSFNLYDFINTESCKIAAKNEFLLVFKYFNVNWMQELGVVWYASKYYM